MARTLAVVLLFLAVIPLSAEAWSNGGADALGPRIRSHRRASAWRAPEIVASRRHPVSAVQVADGPRRLALVVWKRGLTDVGPARDGRMGGHASAVQVAVRRGARWGFGEPVILARRVDGPRVAMNPAGEAVIAWRDRRGRIQAVTRPPNGPLGEPQRVSGPGAGGYALAIGGDGSAVIAWEHGEFPDTSIRAAVRASGSAFGKPTEIGPVGALPVAAVNGVGEGIVTWEDTGERDQPAMASMMSPGGTFDLPQPIPNSERSNFRLSTAIADDGTAIVLVNGELMRHVVKASVLQPDGSFSPAASISGPGNSGNFGEVVVEGENFRAVWAGFSPTRVTTSRYLDHVGWSPPRVLGGRRDTLAAVESNTRGMTAVLTVRNLRMTTIRSFVRLPGEGWGPAEAVARFSNHGLTPNPALSLNAVGRALAAWGGSGKQSERGVFVAERWRLPAH